METLNPYLQITTDLRWRVQFGQSLTQAISESLAENKRNELSGLLRWWRTRDFSNNPTSHLTHSPLIIAQVLELGLKGLPIQARLRELEDHFTKTARQDLQRHIDRLPYKALMPLLIFQLPGLLLLLMGTWINLLKGYL